MKRRPTTTASVMKSSMPIPKPKPKSKPTPKPIPMPILLSIVIPCYNVADQIADLLADIFVQLAPDIELILVNDGSADNSAAVMRTCIERWAPAAGIRLVETVNQGAAAARAHGLALAHGEYVFFCDSDDRLATEFVATLRRTLLAFSAMDALVFSACIEDAATGRRWSKVDYPAVTAFAGGDALVAHNLQRHAYTAAVWTYVFRRTLIGRYHAAFTGRRAHEDHLFTLKVLYAATLIVAVPHVLYTQQMRSGSLTTTPPAVGYLVDRIQAGREASQFLTSVGASCCRLYDTWSFNSVIDILRNSRVLRAQIVRSPVCARYLLGRPYTILGLYLQSLRRALHLKGA